MSPEILAADNSLLLNYSGSSDLFSREPRLGLLAKACHSKGDPMDIRVRFGELSVPAEGVILTIEGGDYRKSYSVFSASEVVNKKNTSKKNDFLVPWRVSVNGKVSGFGYANKTIPGRAAKYEHAFCFADGYTGNSAPGFNKYWSPNTFGYFPLFEDYIPQELIETSTSDALEYNRNEFKRLCGGREATKDFQHVWSKSLPYNNPPVPDNITPWNKEFATKGLFYLDYTPAESDKTENVQVELNQPQAVDSLPMNAAGVSSYHFPLNSSLAHAYLYNGDFMLRLNNRNISKLTLRVGNTVWSWESSNKNASDNNLYLYKKDDYPIDPGLPGKTKDPNNDPFRVSDDAMPESFYEKGYLTGSYFRGTLVKEASLSQVYTSYINNNTPLSLPPVADGTINLVNTENLTFTIAQVQDGGARNGLFSLRVSGQPLKFAPLYVNNTEAASAMTMRNSCY